MQWNKHVWSLFLHILPSSNPIRTENAAKTLNCPFSYTGYKQMAWAVYFDQSGPQRFPYNVMQIMQGSF